MKIALPRLMTALCAAGVLASGAALRADEVTDSINEAVSAYNNKDYATAASSLDTAAQLIRQKRADQFKALLPNPLSGWTGEDATSQSAGAAVFGGGISTERRYSKGDASITVKMVVDSPMLQGVMMMMSNPMFASSDGGKLVKIKNRNAILKFKDGNGSINIVINGAVLLTVEGNSTTEADLRAYAEAVNYTGVAALLPQ